MGSVNVKCGDPDGYIVEGAPGNPDEPCSDYEM
jgi:hypothetical protein